MLSSSESYSGILPPNPYALFCLPALKYQNVASELCLCVDRILRKQLVQLARTHSVLHPEADSAELVMWCAD